MCAHAPPGAFNRRDVPFHGRAVWKGAPLDGRRVLVRCYHGLGDTIQFARYLPIVARRARGMSVQAPTAMHGLLASPPCRIGAMLPLADGLDEPPFGVDVEVMELPHALRSTVATAPGAVPYLAADPARMAAQAARIDSRGGPRVGLAWASGDWLGGVRSLPPEQVRALTALPGVDWVCLQRGPRLAEAQGLPFRDREPRTGDLEDTAALIAGLDLVVSVDGMIAHLAGALARPVWTLLPFAADWRWGLAATRTLWYPTMRLFRQPAPGRWEPAVEAVRAGLATQDFY